MCAVTQRGEKRPKYDTSRGLSHSYHRELSGLYAPPNKQTASSPMIAFSLHPVGGARRLLPASRARKRLAHPAICAHATLSVLSSASVACGFTTALCTHPLHFAESRASPPRGKASAGSARRYLCPTASRPRSRPKWSRATD
eukprot:5191446-Prymnesium_polylepis.2